jgi:hypothetical protein
MPLEATLVEARLSVGTFYHGLVGRRLKHIACYYGGRRCIAWDRPC